MVVLWVVNTQREARAGQHNIVIVVNKSLRTSSANSATLGLGTRP